MSSSPVVPPVPQEGVGRRAMLRAVRRAMAFLTEDIGMAGPVAYAYPSAASDFQCSQVVDRTTGIHGLLRKADLGARRRRS